MANHKAHQSFHVIIPAAGTGARMGGDVPKQYQEIHGKTILRHTLDNILSWDGVLSVQVVIHADHVALYDAAMAGLSLLDPIIGGKDRNISINNALKSFSNVKNEGIVLIHDAARPLVQWDDVKSLLDTLQTHRAATLAVPVSDTLRRTYDDNIADSIVDRHGLWAISTPQGFRYGDIVKAHDNAGTTKAITDDTSLVSAMGIDVKLVHASRSNIKITTPEDMDMARALLKNTYTRTETRTGTGYDVHAFEQQANTDRPLVLCGVTVEHDYALTGHSDADVALHALTDALLGTIGGGDIGLHFPPSDMTYKDLDSRICVEKALDMIAKKNGTINNVDITIICEAPKITPHRNTMQNMVAKILNIDVARVNIKATTSEKLGFTGRREGIAAQAVATISLPL